MCTAVGLPQTDKSCFDQPEPSDRSTRIEMVCRPQRIGQGRTQVPCHVRFGPNFSYRQKMGQAAQTTATPALSPSIDQSHLFGSFGIRPQTSRYGICGSSTSPCQITVSPRFGLRNAVMNSLEFITLQRKLARFRPKRVCKTYRPDFCQIGRLAEQSKQGESDVRT